MTKPKTEPQGPASEPPTSGEVGSGGGVEP